MNCSPTLPPERRQAGVTAPIYGREPKLIPSLPVSSAKKHAAFPKERGVPGWIDKVEGNEFIVTLFAGIRRDIKSAFGPDPYGKSVRALQADEQRNTGSGNVD